MPSFTPSQPSTTYLRCGNIVQSLLPGIFSRPDELIRASKQSPERFRVLADKKTHDLIAYQQQVGLSYVSDPLLHWDDIQRPFALTWQGVEPASLDRFCETNTFYRKIRVKNEIQGGGALEKWLHHDALQAADLPVCATLPDPCTMTTMSEDNYYLNPDELAQAYARALLVEIKSLASLRPLIVLYAPVLAYPQRNAPSPSHITRLAARLDQCALYTPFREAHLHPPTLPHVRNVIQGDNTKLEAIESVADIERNALIAPSCDLQHLPYLFAIRKTKLLADITRWSNEHH